MNHRYCTYADSNYLIRLLAMIQSLDDIQERYSLDVLCLDELSRTLLLNLDLPHVQPVALHNFEHCHQELVALKPSRTLVEYYWTMTPLLISYVLKRSNADVVTYLDSDLFFFSSPARALKELGDSDVLIHEHRFTPQLRHLEQESGRFNVAWLSFRNSANGRQILRWWKERCIEWCYNRYEDGKMGDQLYLNDWPSRFSQITVSSNIGLGAAPWNVDQYKLDVRKQVPHIDGIPIVFYHYQAFDPVTPDLYIVSRHNTYPLPENVLQLLYTPYVKAVDAALSRVRSILPEFDRGFNNNPNAARGRPHFARTSRQNPRKGASNKPRFELIIPKTNETAPVSVQSNVAALLWSETDIVSCEEELLLALRNQPISKEIKSLFVIGAHRFQERALLDEIFPNLESIILFEPLPNVYASLCSNVKNDARVKVFPFAVADINDCVTFHVADNEASSSLLEFKEHSRLFPHVRTASTIQVECRTLPWLVEHLGLSAPDMLIIDAQGAEHRILTSLSALKTKCKLIYTEVSKIEVYAGARLLKELRELMAPDYDFRGYAPLINQIPDHGNALFSAVSVRDSFTVSHKPASAPAVHTPVRARDVSLCIITNSGLLGKENRSLYLERLLASAERCGVVNGNSEIIIAGASAIQRPNVKVLDLPHLAEAGRVCHLRNAAIAASTGKLIVLCDDDILFKEGYCSVFERNRNSHWDILCTRLLNPNGSRYWDWPAYVPGKGQTLLPYNVEHPFVFATGGHAIYRRSIFEKVRWNEALKHGDNEEYDFADQARRNQLQYRMDANATVFLQYHHCDAEAVVRGQPQKNEFVNCPDIERTLASIQAIASSSNELLRRRLGHKFRGAPNTTAPTRSSKKVSVLVGCYRYLNRFKLFAESLLRQDFDPSQLEVVVANPQSPDGLSDYLTALKSRTAGRPGPSFVEVELAQQHHRNRGMMIQKALEHSVGEVIIGMDCDLVLPTNFITTVYNAVVRNPQRIVGVYRNFLSEVTTDAILSGNIDPWLVFSELSREDEKEESGYRGVLGYCQAASRKAWMAHGYPTDFDEIAKSDVAFVERLVPLGYAPLFLKDTKVLHLKHPRNWAGTTVDL